jgi:hypothetical protein
MSIAAEVVQQAAALPLVVKGLNISEKYAENIQGFEGCRELVQNWIDQCERVCKRTVSPNGSRFPKSHGTNGFPLEPNHTHRSKPQVTAFTLSLRKYLGCARMGVHVFMSMCNFPLTNADAC